MADAFQVDASQLHRHAAKLLAVRDQLDAIKSASSAIGQNDAAYGMLCGWISAILERRHQGTDELFGLVDENLRAAADAITATARDYEAADAGARDRITRAGGR
ncbi:hypothetical protein [Actinoplanes couchii]|uniref:Excreted virulence factor EspC, type VII ESX diderm n=1 Tax=Actinoplanes couchii TaxID=403638 RepID=A0ABQ3XEN1_9ACTN|nr:hypothetical protein [Actinoplanes couchii]MDR6319778.1 hypothetical protein [Actinoplanes couchii]GID56913.1 hypothetical protein Aco03nite_053170 [Actinoplanes couchii]